MVKHKRADYQYALIVSVLDCTGCASCANVCPTKSLTMKPIASELDRQKIYDALVDTSEKPELLTNNTIGVQYRKPYLEFSGACAGCGETPYAKLATQLYGDRMYIANATGCSSIWGGSAPSTPYTVDKNGHGPAWSNSLFEDNAEFGYGMLLAQKQIRERLAMDAQQLLDTPVADKAQAWLDTYEDAATNTEPAQALIAALQTAALEGDAKAAAADFLKDADYAAKKYQFIFGGDGWAYDIGFGGLDHVIASNENVNIVVFDTEVYSNTGGQASKSSNIGQVAQFAAAGKETKKKSLAEIAMSYGYVYVAQVAMGANPAQTLKAIQEAEAYHGPSLIIGYAPCEMHSIKGGMTNCQAEMKKAVECGYWNLFRFNPAAETDKFIVDSKEPKEEGYRAFLMNEARYSRLTREFPDRAETLFKRNEEVAMDRYQHLLKLKAMYDEK